MSKNIFCLFFLAILFFSCSEKKADKLFQPVEEVKVHDLETQGFERVIGVDVLLFEKEREDTTFLYQFSSFTALEEPAESVSWKIKMDSIDREKVSTILMKQRCHIVSDFSDKDRFFVRCLDQNILMRGRLGKWDDQGYIYLTYDYPNF